MKKELNKFERSSYSLNNLDKNNLVRYTKTNSDRHMKCSQSKSKSKFLNINLSNINEKQIINDNNDNKEFYNNFLISLKLDNSNYHNSSKLHIKAKHADSLSSCSSRNGLKYIHPVGKEFNKNIKKINLSTLNSKDQASTHSIENRKGSNLTNENGHTNLNNNNLNQTNQQPPSNISARNNINVKKNIPITNIDQIDDTNKKLDFVTKKSIKQPTSNINLRSKNASYDNSPRKEIKRKSLPKQVIDKVISYQTCLKLEEKPNQLKKKSTPKRLFFCCIPCSSKTDSE